MVYQSFTDLLDELKHHSLDLINNNETKDILVTQARGSLNFIEAVRSELSGLHIEGPTIYRAIAKAQLLSLKSPSLVTEEVLVGIKSVGDKLLIKADSMERHRKPKVTRRS